MPSASESLAINCPFCAEQIELSIDRTAGSQQQFIYDCEVCCRPIEVNVSNSLNDEISLSVDKAYEA